MRRNPTPRYHTFTPALFCLLTALLILLIPTAPAAPRAAAKPRADLMIKNAADPESAYALNDVYQRFPAGDQKCIITMANGTKAVFNVKVENDGRSRQAILLKMQENRLSGGDAWTISYKLGATDVTASLRSEAGWTTDILQPGQSHVVNIEMQSLASGNARTACSVHLTAMFEEPGRRLGYDEKILDAVAAVVSTSAASSAYRPDMLIRNPGDRGYRGAKVFAIDGIQSRAQIIGSGTTAVFCLRLQNEGSVPDRFHVNGTGT